MWDPAHFLLLRFCLGVGDRGELGEAGAGGGGGGGGGGVAGLGGDLGVGDGGGGGGDSLEAWEGWDFFLEGRGEGHREDVGGASRDPGRQTCRPRRGHHDIGRSSQLLTRPPSIVETSTGNAAGHHWPL